MAKRPFARTRWIPENEIRESLVLTRLGRRGLISKATSAQLSFWSLNAGLAWMVFATLFPLGLLQLYESVNHGYFEARTLKYMTSDVNALIEWLRLPGDAVFIVGGVLPVLYLCWMEDPPCRSGLNS